MIHYQHCYNYYFLFKKYRMTMQSLKSLSVPSSPAMVMEVNPPVICGAPPTRVSPVCYVRKEERGEMGRVQIPAHDFDGGLCRSLMKYLLLAVPSNSKERAVLSLLRSTENTSSLLSMSVMVTLCGSFDD